MAVERTELMTIADECVQLVAKQFVTTLDWQLASLEQLDAIADRLLESGPLSAERLDLWWKLIGAYLGEVIIRALDGTWIEHEQAEGAYAVAVLGITGFPFAITARVLQGEPYKSFASFGRSLPAIANRKR
ncbi:hypothetical protein [Flexivirga endophytica]|nr:hypothetical protein [Flexivirga endophytica]